MDNKIKKVLAASLITCALAIPTFAQDTQEQAAVETQTVETPSVKTQAAVPDKNLKTVPHKSFFSKFKKKDKNEIPIVNDVPMYEAGVVYNLDDCIKIGLKNSPFIKNLRDTKEIQKQEVNSAKANYYYPQINAGTGYSFGKTNYSGDGVNKTVTTRNGFGFDVGLSEVIFDFGRSIAKINMNKFNLESAGYDLDDGILDTVFDIKVAYANVLSKRANRRVLIENVKINQLNVERTKAMYEVGLRSKIDLVNAEGNLTTAEISLLEGEKSYQESLINLNSEMYYINAPVYSLKPTETFNFGSDLSIKNEINVSYDQSSYGDIVPLSMKDGSIYSAGIEKQNFVDTYSFTPFKLTLKESMDKAFADRYDLKSTKMVKRAAEESLKAVKRSWYPQLNVSANYGLGINDRSLSEPLGNVSNSMTLYGGLDFPVFNPVYIKHQIDIAKLNVDKAQNNIDLLENDIYFEIQDLYVTMKQLEKKIPLMRKRVDEFRENFELADGRYAVGLGDYIALQQAIMDYNKSQLAFIEAVFLYNVAIYELERAMAVGYTVK